MEKKPVKGYEENYYLDPDSLQVINRNTNRPLSIWPDGAGYPSVQLWKNNKGTNKLVHILFAEAYVPNPDGLPMVNHKDEDPRNYPPDNLEWCTQKYNQNYGTVNERRGASISAAMAGKSKPWVAEQKGVPVIGTDSDGNERYFESGRAADRELGLAPGSVARTVRGVQKTAGGYKFRRAK